MSHMGDFMRGKHKSWDNRKRTTAKGRYQTWTKRVIWYAGAPGESTRLEFTDEDGITHRFYRTDEEAQRDYDRFRKGEVGTLALREEGRAKSSP